MHGHLSRLCLFAAAAVLAFGCGDGHVIRGATINVNDHDFLGAPGDAALSLTEAIELATGDLDSGALSEAERAQLEGHPGAGRRDRIRFAQDLSVAIRRREGAVDSILPPLTDAGDSIDGQGAVLDGTPMGGEPQEGTTVGLLMSDTELLTVATAPLLVVAASGLEVRGLVVHEVPATAIVVAGGPGEGVRDVRIEDNEIRGIGRDHAVAGMGITATGGTNVDGYALTDVQIARNEIVDMGGGIVILGGSGIGAGQTAARNRAERIEVRDNRIVRPVSGITAYAALAMLGGEASDNFLGDLEVIGNTIVENLDVGILLSTTGPADGGPTARNRITDVDVRNNEITSPHGWGRANTGMLVTGGQVFIRGTSTDDVFTDLLIEDNVVDGHATGLLLAAGDAERCGEGCGTAGSVLEDVRVRGNAWSNVTTGAILTAAMAPEAAATVEGNFLLDVTLEDEKIAASQTGLLIDGGQASNFGDGPRVFLGGKIFPGAGLPGEVRNNTVSGVTVRDSRISADISVVMIVGGLAVDTEDTVSASTVGDIVLKNNVLVSGSQPAMLVIGGIVVDAGAARDCRVEGVRALGNRDQDGAPISASVRDEMGPPTSVSGNTVSDVIVE